MFPKENDNPFEVFASWYKEAEDCKQITQPDAVNLATATKEAIPSSRMVLLKGYNKDGFVFFTNYGSRKAAELQDNPHAALCFFWQQIGKQIRITGKVEKVSPEESDEYFASRPKQSQIGAWASKQSQPLGGKKELLAEVAKIGIKYNIGTVPRPQFWGGYRLIPDAIEFWQLGDFRIHDRMVFQRSGQSWNVQRLYP